MSNSNTTERQIYRNGMLQTESSSVQNTNIQNVDSMNPGYLTQERSNYLNNDNNSISQSIFMKPSDNTIEQPAATSPVEFSEQNYPTASKQIQMKSQPRGQYHPRNAKECIKATHFIRCDDGESDEYPTIHIKPQWQQSSPSNYIEVALVDKNHHLHPYTIDDKRRTGTDLPPTGLGSTDQASNILLFHVANDDFATGHKSFKIQLIKSKQNDYITGDLIRRRELYISMLRFTRIYLEKDCGYYRDEASTGYSCEMTEKYSDVAVVHVNPRCGPLGGCQQLNVVLTGLKAQDRKKLSIEIVENTCEWKYNIKAFHIAGNSIWFSMPAFPHPSTNNILTSILIYFDGDAIHEAPFVYIPMLDPILKQFNLNEGIVADNDSSQTGSEKPTAKNHMKRQRMN